MTIANHLRNALANGEFLLYYQPKIDLITGRITGAEALIRWHNTMLGDISPHVFIPLAEKMGLIRDIGSWVLQEACGEAVSWKEMVGETLQVSVNVSPQQFRSGFLLEDVDLALRASGLASTALELEITESLLLFDSKDQLDMLHTLNTRGVLLALDDFGTGYSSLSYLKRFPVKVLKIDRSFINDLMENENSKALVEAIIAMARSLKLNMVAEGVETEEQLAFLRDHDVVIAQGFYFSPPIPPEQFKKMLNQRQPHWLAIDVSSQMD